jgi:hypothetical protein
VRKFLIGAVVLATALITAAVALGTVQRTFVMTFGKTATATSTSKPNTATPTFLSEDSLDPANGANFQQPPQDDLDTIIFPPGTTLDQSAAPQCNATDAQFAQKGEAACPKKSNVGSGHARLRTKFQSAGEIQATVTLFNGKNKKLLTYVNPQGANPQIIRTSVQGKKGKNQKFSIPVPVSCVLGSPPDCTSNGTSAGDVRIVHLDLTIPKLVLKKKKNGKTIKIPLLKTPKKCPASHKWTFTFKFHHRDGSTTDVKTSDVPCKNK